MQHNFDVDIATRYGISIAAFLGNIAYWVHLNLANNKNFHEGRYWTYNSVEAFKIIFPYWSTRELRTIIDKCIKNDLLLKGNFNKSSYDRTCWYTLTDKSLDLFPFAKKTLETASQLICRTQQINLSHVPNQFVAPNEPIPDIKTDIKPDKSRENENARFPLSVLMDFPLKEKTKELVEKNGINEKSVKIKFRDFLGSRGKATFCVASLEKWFDDEIHYVQYQKNKKNNELISTVKDFVKPEKIEVSSKERSKTQIKAIKKALGRK